MPPHVDHAAIQQLFIRAAADNRLSLFEYEVYDLIKAMGSETPPLFSLLQRDAPPDQAGLAAALAAIPGDRIVVKVVSPSILHKSDIGGVRIAAKTCEEVLAVTRQIYREVPEKLAARIEERPRQASGGFDHLRGEALVEAITADIRGVVLCQYIHPDSEQFGNELLVSLRRTREFGMILSAGLGGTDTELYARQFRKGQALALASTAMVDGETFFSLFRHTISYKKLAGLTRGGKRIVTDVQLLDCFSAMIEVGNAYAVGSGHGDVIIDELEINPFAFSNHRMVPLDGLCRLSPAGQKPAPSRPIEAIDRLLHPATIGIAGVSSGETNIGRIILENILKNGFEPAALRVIHPTPAVIDGIATVPGLRAMGRKVDLLILAVSATYIPGMIDDIINHDLAWSSILIPGGLGEKKGQEQVRIDICRRIAEARDNQETAAVFLGANSLGVLSHPGRYDSMFIPDSKLPKNRGRHSRRSALVSQSGAYMITRMSKLSFLDPAYAVSIGNQIDLTASDFLRFFNGLPEIQTIAFYVEGFTDLDGLEFARAVRQAIPAGKEIILYKAGRTPAGKTALAGHTASIAGNYLVCESCISQAGAMVAENFTVFEGLLRLSCALHDKNIAGNRLGAVSNAGYEAVGIADNILGEDYSVAMAHLGPTTQRALAAILAEAGLSELTDIRNPLDITPMAGEDVYEKVIQTLLDDPRVDAIIVAIVPLTPLLHTLPDECAPTESFTADQSIINRVVRINARSAKPLVLVVDSGPLYDYMADAFQQQGCPVFRSADQAVRVLGKYIQGRLRAQKLHAQPPAGRL
ncbi:MAG: acetate--CoA ligase family protein [Desulfocapsaceae bacterium]|nr:acetate--CoA ligase family protein [Desulfocapsaceae bacterium]